MRDKHDYKKSIQAISSEIGSKYYFTNQPHGPYEFGIEAYQLMCLLVQLKVIDNKSRIDIFESGIGHNPIYLLIAILVCEKFPDLIIEYTATDFSNTTCGLGLQTTYDFLNSLTFCVKAALPEITESGLPSGLPSGLSFSLNHVTERDASHVPKPNADPGAAIVFLRRHPIVKVPLVIHDTTTNWKLAAESSIEQFAAMATSAIQSGNYLLLHVCYAEEMAIILSTVRNKIGFFPATGCIVNSVDYDSRKISGMGVFMGNSLLGTKCIEAAATSFSSQCHPPA